MQYTGSSHWFPFYISASWRIKIKQSSIWAPTFDPPTEGTNRFNRRSSQCFFVVMSAFRLLGQDPGQVEQDSSMRSYMPYAGKRILPRMSAQRATRRRLALPVEQAFRQRPVEQIVWNTFLCRRRRADVDDNASAKAVLVERHRAPAVVASFHLPVPTVG